MSKRTQDKVGVYSDLPFNMALDATGDVPVTSVEHSIKQSLFNIIHTRKGSRQLNPNFGCLLDSYLFEPFDAITARSIGESIDNAFTQWETRIDVQSIVITMDNDNLLYELNITYQIKNVQQRDSVIFTLQKL